MVSACAHHHHLHPSLPRVLGAWPGCCALPLFASLRHARATLNGGGDTPRAQRRWRQQASAQSSASTAPSTKCFIYTLGPGGSGGDRTRLKTSLSAHHRCSSAPQLSPLRNHHRIAVSCWASQPYGATLLESSSLPGHMTELFHPFTSTTTSTSTATAASHTNPLSFTSLPASPLRLRLLLSAEPLSCAQPPGPSQASASRAHTPRTPACTRLATLVPLTLTRPPSRCTALPLPVATLGSRALLQIHPPFRQTCLLAYLPACFDCETLLPPLLRFRALRIPSSPSSHSGFARLHVHKRLLVLHLASLHLATPTPSRAPLLDLVTATRSSFEHP